MFTILLAWIRAKYPEDRETGFLYLLTFILDIGLFALLDSIFK